MARVLKAPSAADFLAIVPEIAGFHPRESLVLVAFDGRRTRGAMRFDLPASDSPAVCARVAATLVGMLSKLEGADGVVPVVYTDAPFGPDIPRSAIVDAVIERAEQAGFDVRDALCVAGDGWGSYYDPDRPPGGRPLAEIDHSPLREESAAIRPPVAGDQRGDTALPRVDLATVERVARILRELAARPSCERIPTVLDDVPSFLEEVIVGAEQLLDASAAVVIVLAQRAPFRDAVMLQWAFDRDVGDRVAACDDAWTVNGAPSDPDLAGLMMGEGPQPDPDRLARAVDLAAAMAARAPRSQRAPLLTVLAWLQWASGRSSVARAHLDAVAVLDPGYGLAGLLGTMLDRGMLPEWAFRRPPSPTDRSAEGATGPHADERSGTDLAGTDPAGADPVATTSGSARSDGGGGDQSRAHASVSTDLRMPSISSNSGGPIVSGGASCTTGSPRSSARQ